MKLHNFIISSIIITALLVCCVWYAAAEIQDRSTTYSKSLRHYGENQAIIYTEGQWTSVEIVNRDTSPATVSFYLVYDAITHTNENSFQNEFKNDVNSLSENSRENSRVLTRVDASGWVNNQRYLGTWTQNTGYSFQYFSSYTRMSSGTTTSTSQSEEQVVKEILSIGVDALGFSEDDKKWLGASYELLPQILSLFE